MEEHGAEDQEKVSHEGYARREACEVTEELRVERLLERCRGEAIEVTMPEVKLALQQEEADLRYP